MTWVPGEELHALLEKVLTRAREAALVEFSDARKRIEHEQAAKGVLGGPVARRCIEVAGARIKSFADAAGSELLVVLTRGGALHGESVRWTRATVNGQVDILVNGLGGQIDALKTTAGLTPADSQIVADFGGYECDVYFMRRAASTLKLDAVPYLPS